MSQDNSNLNPNIFPYAHTYYNNYLNANHVPIQNPYYHYNPMMYELNEMKKNMEILYTDFNKLKSLQELNNNNSVLANTFIDKTVDKFKLYDETNQEFLSQMKVVDARLNSAFRKIDRIKKNVDKVNIKEEDKKNEDDEDNEDNDNEKPNKKSKPAIKRRIIMSGPPPSMFPLMSMLSGMGGSSEMNFGLDKKEVKNELIDSEDEYDMKSEVYLQPDLTKMENDIIEVKLEINSITDLIEIGLKYKALNQEKEEREQKQNKEKEEKNIKKNSEPLNDNIVKNKKGGIIILNKKSNLSDQNINNDISSLISQAFNQAILDSVNEAMEDNKKEMEKQKKKYNEEQNDDPHFYEFLGKKYSVDINKLINLVEPLQKLQNMIGMTKIKENILEMILYYIQKFESTTSNMLHTSIEGPPGVGKTKLGRILAQIYYALGVIPSKRFKRVRRTDLVGKYLGHTAHKTQEVINEAEGGVLFIDEAYSLGSADGEKDIYSKECIDTINMNLTEKKKNLIVIIAGYTDQLDRSFFAVNEGLKRRFPFKFTIEGYNETEMRDIFYAQIRRMKWFLDTEVTAEFLEEFFKKNKKELPHFGGDIETILLNCKMAHAKRVLGKPYIYHKIINKDDINIAYDRFKQNKKKKEDLSHLNMMYN